MKMKSARSWVLGLGIIWPNSINPTATQTISQIPSSKPEAAEMKTKWKENHKHYLPITWDRGPPESLQKRNRGELKWWSLLRIRLVAEEMLQKKTKQNKKIKINKSSKLSIINVASCCIREKQNPQSAKPQWCCFPLSPPQKETFLALSFSYSKELNTKMKTKEYKKSRKNLKGWSIKAVHNLWVKSTLTSIVAVIDINTTPSSITKEYKNWAALPLEPAAA